MVRYNLDVACLAELILGLIHVTESVYKPHFFPTKFVKTSRLPLIDVTQTGLLKDHRAQITHHCVPRTSGYKSEVLYLQYRAFQSRKLSNSDTTAARAISV